MTKHEKLTESRSIADYQETQKRNRYVAAILVATMIVLILIVIIRVVLW